MATAFLKGAATFTYTPPGGSPIEHKLAVPLLQRPGAYVSTVRKRRWAWESPDRTEREVHTIGSQVEDVAATVRFENEPAALIDLLRTALDDNVLVTYQREAAGPTVDYLVVSVEGSSSVVQLSPDRDRFGLGEWEASLVLRATYVEPELVLGPWRAWIGEDAIYYTDQAGTTLATTAGATVRSWRDSINGDLTIWDNATFGATPPTLHASLDRLTMGVYQGMEWDPASLFISGSDVPFSIMARARPTGAMNQSRCWGGFGADGSNPHHLIYTDVIPAGSYLGWQSERRDDAGTQVDGASASGLLTPTAGTEYRRWYVFDGAVARDYVNGTLVSTTTMNVGALNTSIMFIGTDNSGAVQDSFIGDYLDFYVFDHAVNDATRAAW